MQAMSLLPLFPCLEELYLGNNSIQGLDFQLADSPATTRLQVHFPQLASRSRYVSQDSEVKDMRLKILIKEMLLFLNAGLSLAPTRQRDLHDCKAIEGFLCKPSFGYVCDGISKILVAL